MQDLTPKRSEASDPEASRVRTLDKRGSFLTTSAAMVSATLTSQALPAHKGDLRPSVKTAICRPARPPVTMRAPRPRQIPYSANDKTAL